MSNAIPKFNFSGSTIKTEEELSQLTGGERQGDKFFRPGTYQANIVKVEYTGVASDDRWGKFNVHLEGTGGKEIRTTVMVPFRDIAYTAKSGKNTGLPYLKYKNFMLALGVKLDLNNYQTVTAELFTNPDKTLVGKDVSINVGYEGNYIGYMGKDEIGIRKFNITMKDGSVLSDASGKIITFPERDAALHHAEVSLMTVDRYTRVLDFNEGKVSAPQAGW